MIKLTVTRKLFMVLNFLVFSIIALSFINHSYICMFAAIGTFYFTTRLDVNSDGDWKDLFRLR